MFSLGVLPTAESELSNCIIEYVRRVRNWIRKHSSLFLRLSTRWVRHMKKEVENLVTFKKNIFFSGHWLWSRSLGNSSFGYWEPIEHNKLCTVVFRKILSLIFKYMTNLPATIWKNIVSLHFRYFCENLLAVLLSTSSGKK